jgi:tRNA A22 N-methylase
MADSATLRQRKERQCTYKRNIEARSRIIFCHGKALSITYSQCASVALVIQAAMRMHRIVICGLSGCTIFSRIAKAARFLENKN